MRIIVPGRVSALTFLVGSLAAEEWKFITSRNFELYTTAGSGEARRTIEYFETVRDFFERTRNLGPDSKLPVTIILFRNSKEFRPYVRREGVAAFYAGDNSRDYIVMSGAADDDRPIAVHEFIHLLVRRGNLNLPVWLNEGVAELYSTIKPYANTVGVGAVPGGRVASLEMDKWIPLGRLMEMTKDSPEYNTKQHAGTFYAQSWLLTHMLALGDDYRPAFPKFVEMVIGGADGETAFSSVYSKTLAAVEKDLKDYFRIGSVKVALLPTQLRKVETGQPGPADAVLVKLHLARILATISRVEESSARLKQLAAENPDRWEVQDALGQIAWRRGGLEEARDAMRKAVALKPPAWNVYYDYARLAFSNEDEGAAVLAALREVVRLNPTHLEARLLTGEQMYRMKQYREALDHYKTIKSVTPALAARMFIGMAWSNLRAEQLTDARLAALNALKYVRDDRDKQNVDRILDYLDRRREAENAATAAAPVTNTAPTARQSVTPAPDEVRPIKAKPILSSVRGVLQHVDCDVNQAKLTVVSAGKTVQLLISDPGAIAIRNQPGTSMNLTCGPQAKSVQIAVEYLDKSDAKTGTIGEVRAVEFLN